MTRRPIKPSPGQMPIVFGEQQALSDHETYWVEQAEKEENRGGLRSASQELRAVELIAAITDLGHEQVETIMKKAGGLHKLAQLPEYALQSLPHVDEHDAKKIRGLTEWALLLGELDAGRYRKIRTPTDVANLVLTEMGLLDKEELRVVGLDAQRQIAGMETVYRGSVNSIGLRVGEVMRMPISLQCTAMILLHNHPSGNPEPSPEDVQTTGRIAEAAKQLDIELLDHLVIGRNQYVSMKGRGMGF